MSWLMWLAAKALGAGRWLGGIVRAIGRWLVADWRNGPLAMFALLVAAHILVLDPRLRRERDAALAGWNAEKAAHAKTVRGYRAAAQAAENKARDNVERVIREQDTVTREIVDDYQARIAAARARAGELATVDRLRRAGTPAADPGRAPAAGVSGPGQAAAGAGPASAQDRLSAACPAGSGAQGQLSESDALIATEQAIQLDALIDWVLAQGRIEFSPPKEPGQ